MNSPAELAEHLGRERDVFVAFVRARIADPELAADIVQDSLLKALKSAGQLKDGESVVAWFYRILRRTIIDVYRRRDARQRGLDRLEAELSAPPDAAEHRAVCACVEALIPSLKPEYAQLIRRIDLGGQKPESVAAELGTTANNLRVRHHRALQQLRKRLEDTCRLCAKHGCLDCDCA